MANAIAVNDIFEATLICSTPFQYSANVIHYKCTATAGTGATDQDVTTGLSTSFAAVYKPVLSVNARFEGVRGQIIKPTRRPVVTSTSGAGVGTLPGDLIPSQVAAVLSKRTNVASKSTRGRIYVAFPDEDANEINGTPSAAYLGLLAAVANLADDTLTIGAGVNTVTMQPVVYSRKLGTAQPIVVVTVNPRWATQRRRSHQYGEDTLPLL